MEKAEFEDSFFKAGFKMSIQPFAAPGNSDQPAEVDRLDRTRYVNALAALISHQRTEVPLTIGIYGEWGSGKSSFMKQLARILSRKHQTIDFNAWRFSDSKDLWAELVHSVAAALDKQLPLYLRLWFLIASGDARYARSGFSKLWGRFLAGARKLENWLVAPIAGVGVLKLTGNLGLPDITSSKLLSSLFNKNFLEATANILPVVGIVLIVISLSVILYKIVRIVLRPFSTQFEVYLSRYKTGAEERLRMTQADLNTISEMLSRFALRTNSTKPPIVVFLDDLDRCPPNRIVEILEAVNLFFEGLPLVTVFGLSPRVVSMAIANEYNFLLKRDATPEELDTFGRSFLQKIIHIPFQLPSPRKLENYVRSLMVGPKDQLESEAERNNILFGRETLQQYSGLRRLLHYPYTWYIDLGTLLMRRSAVTADQVYQLGIINRLLHRLPLLSEQEKWIHTRPPHERTILEQFREKLDWQRPSFFKIPGLLQTVKKASEDALSVQIEMENSDANLLQGFSTQLLGNPRTIKRFVNVYQLAKGINAQLPPEQQAPMQGLAAWLVLLQNWPRQGAELQRAALSDPTKFLSADKITIAGDPPSDDLAQFVKQYKKQLTSLAKRMEGIEIAGCFSFLSSHVRFGNTSGNAGRG